jgi:Ca2+-binding EF-hand superfamily protein
MPSAVSSSTVSDWSTQLFSRLDTKKQGYIEKADIETAFAKTATAGTDSTADTAAADKFFDDVDTDGDGKLTKSELSTAISKVADELNAQFDQSRVSKGGGGPPPGGAAGGPPPSGGAGATDDSTSTDSDTAVAAADTNGDGTVSAEEAAAYAQAQAAKSAAASVSGSDGSTTVSATSASRGTRVDNGLSKDQLTERLNAVEAKGDTRQSDALKKLIENFDKADADGDGKLTRTESRDYVKSTREAGQAAGTAGTAGTAGSSALGGGPADALAKALELLKAYVNNQAQATASGSSTSNASSISTTA